VNCPCLPLSGGNLLSILLPQARHVDSLLARRGMSVLLNGPLARSFNTMKEMMELYMYTYLYIHIYIHTYTYIYILGEPPFLPLSDGNLLSILLPQARHEDSLLARRGMSVLLNGPLARGFNTMKEMMERVAEGRSLARRTLGMATPAGCALATWKNQAGARKPLKRAMTHFLKIGLIKVRIGLAYTRYSFTARLLCTNQPSFHSPRPPTLLTLVQYYSARLLGSVRLPLRTLVCRLHTTQYW